MERYKIKGLDKLIGVKIGRYTITNTDSHRQMIVLERTSQRYNPIIIEIVTGPFATYMRYHSNGKYYSYILHQPDVATASSFINFLKTLF